MEQGIGHTQINKIGPLVNKVEPIPRMTNPYAATFIASKGVLSLDAFKFAFTILD